MKKSQTLDVIGFTIRENLKKKSIYITTIIIACVCMLAIPLIAYISLGNKDKDKSKDNKIEKIYIFDTTEFGNVGYESIASIDKKYKDIKIEYKSIYESENGIDSNKGSNEKKGKTVLTKYAIRQFSERYDECIEENKGKACVIARVIHIDGKEITLDLTIPKDTKIKKSHATEIGGYMNQLITMKKYELASKDEGELLELMAGVNVSVHTLGKGKDNEMLHVVKMIVPMIVTFIMYFMLMSYGQSLCNGMVTEKNSKIIELLVSHTRPKKLIIGKVLGYVVIALGQIFVWIISLVIGVFIGNEYSNSVNGKDFINITGIIKMIKDANVDSAFSIGAIIVAILIMLLGFIFYCVYAAICGSFVNKPDEVSSVFAVYTYTNVIAFLAIYMGTAMEKKSLVSVIRYIPFCAPYGVPVDVLLGEISIAQGLIIAVILALSTIAIIYILGKVYESLVFNSLSIKQLLEKKHIKSR